MAISFGSSGNNFGTFLGTVNSARSAYNTKEAFDSETAAKQALATLSSLSSYEHALPDKDLRDRLGLSEDQFSQVVELLEKQEMILPLSQTGHLVKLTDFAAEALKVFNVS